MHCPQNTDKSETKMIKRHLVCNPLKIHLEVKYGGIWVGSSLKVDLSFYIFTCFDLHRAGAGVWVPHLSVREMQHTTLGVLWTCPVVLVLCKVVPWMDMCVALHKVSYGCAFEFYWFWQLLVDVMYWYFVCLSLSDYRFTSLWIVVRRGTAFSCIHTNAISVI